MPSSKPTLSLFEQMDADAAAERRMAAAMFAALGDKTELSASGHSVIFKPEHRFGRADLSGNPEIARRQLEHAGIDPDTVTDEQVQAYAAWFDEMYETRRIAGAKILITAKFSDAYSGGMGACGVFNRVSLIDGWGNTVDSTRVECRDEWDPSAINQLHQPGAVRRFPDYNRINEAIASMCEKYPELAGAPTQDNNIKQYEPRRVADARIVITAKFDEPYSGGQGACGVFNRVCLVDGWGNTVVSERVECRSEMCQDVINRIGLPGAVVARPDYDRIEGVIARMRQDHPELAGAPVHDNNAKEPTRMKSVKLKTICSDSNAHTTLAHPQSPLGNNHDASVQVRQINDVPENVTPDELIRLFEHTVDMSWVGRPCGRCEIHFSELGPGKIIRYEAPDFQTLDNDEQIQPPKKATPKMGM